MAHEPRPATHADHPSARTEDADINVWAVFCFGASLIGVAIVVHVIVLVMFGYFNGREAARVAPEYPLAAGDAGREPPEPRLQTNPRADLRALRTHEDELLNNYGWVDKQAGVVRIPIEAAIRMTAQRGLPAREEKR